MNDLRCQLKASVSFQTTHDGFKGPLVLAHVFNIDFTNDRKTADATRFTPIVLEPIKLPHLPGKDTITIERVGDGKGTFDIGGTKAIEIPIRVVFLHSHPLIARSHVRLPLTTGSSTGTWTLQGRPVAPIARTSTASVKLVAEGEFEDGALKGDRCSVEIDGTIEPSPLF